MSEGAPSEGDRAVRNSTWAIVGTAIAIALSGAVSVSTRFALGVLVGGAVAALNLVALGRIGRGFVSPRPGIWAILYLAKVFALFAVVFVVLNLGVASGVGIVVGLVTLAPGIVIGALTVR